jgi:telomere length regulation protein
MIVGVAISRLVDEPGKTMDFGEEEMDGEEGKAWLGLVDVNDKVGKIEDLYKIKDQHKLEATVQSAAKTNPTAKKAKPTPAQPTTSKIISITELSSSDSESSTSPSSHLNPYPPPDFDPSDSDSDPTLISRIKPTAPVYIHTLISSLTSSDPSTITLALRTAPSLIRRKATFGTELSSSLDALASALLNLSEGMSKPAQQSHRLSALIALVVASPERMGPWLCAMYFEGDVSLVQRATLLSAIGLGVRELAGYSTVDTDEKSRGEGKGDASFPSKRLPPSLSGIYTLTNTLSGATLQPLASAAAETLSGPAILNTRVISSRLTKSRLSHNPTATTPHPNLHALLPPSFLLPLLTRLLHLISTSRQSPILTPHPLSLLLRTIYLLLHTLGPSTPSHPTLTRETLSLLLTLHNHPIALDPMVLPCILSLLLCILDLNTSTSTSEARLVTNTGAQVSELISWISNLQSQSSHIPTISDPSTGNTMPWTALAAGCQVKWQEVGRKFQGRMLGLRSGELDGF